MFFRGKYDIQRKRTKKSHTNFTKVNCFGIPSATLREKKFGAAKCENI